MNQWLADLFFALPPWLVKPYVFGTFCLIFLWLCYFFDIRAMITRRVRKHCSEAYRRENLSPMVRRILYGSVRKKAKLDEGGAYLFHLLSLIVIVSATVLHAALFGFCLSGVQVASVADSAVLTVVVSTLGILSLATQPASTMERRSRWGFRLPGTVVRAVLREVIIVAVIFLWIYDAYFFQALL